MNTLQNFKAEKGKNKVQKHLKVSKSDYFESHLIKYTSYISPKALLNIKKFYTYSGPEIKTKNLFINN